VGGEPVAARRHSACEAPQGTGVQGPAAPGAARPKDAVAWRERDGPARIERIVRDRRIKLATTRRQQHDQVALVAKTLTTSTIPRVANRARATRAR